MAVHIQTRRGTAAEWATANPVLADGEIGVETDTRKMKIGNGVTAWTSLLYLSAAATAAWGGITGTLSAQTDLQAALDAKLTTPGVWTAWTPTLGGAGSALGNGTVSAFYSKMGRTVHFRASIVLGSTSTIGTNPTVTLPVAADAGAVTNGVEVAIRTVLFDASVSSRFYGVVAGTGASQVTLLLAGTNGAQVNLTATVPFTWTTSDEIRIAGTYQAAA